jgi:serine/threonine-protein kinase
MTIATLSEFVEALRRDHFLEPAQLDELTSLQSRFSEPRHLAKELIQRGWLTPYQVNHLLQGRRGDLVLGPYVLLERLGEGGTGQVFKARHRRVGRVVALKVVPKERLANPEAVRRFHQEMEATAKLSHPNAVFAYDADQIGDTHCIAMEYFEGADLARLVKQRGPLPAAVACDYIRQAALGLQHAHEQGLVHRNIKPANLLLAVSRLPPQASTRPEKVNGGVVKVLDLGLARLQWSMGDEGARTVLPEGTVMGTPDYIAPEQAVSAGKADARSDLYSLGCSFYFLLTGQPPFPGGSLAEKLIKHQFEEPAAVEQLRPDIPPEVAAVVRKLMAKRPEDRYQTAAALVHALAVVQNHATSLVPGAAQAIPVAQPLSAPPDTTVAAEPASDLVPSFLEESVRTRMSRRPRQITARQRWLWIGAAAVAVLAMATVLAVRFLGPSPGKEDSRADTGRHERDRESSSVAIFADEFNGTKLGSAWGHQSYDPAGGGPESIALSAGILSLAGTQVMSVRKYAPVAVTARLRFGEAQHQHFGLATGFDPIPEHCWAIFSTAGTTDTLSARVNVLGAMKDEDIGPLPSGFHEYAIKPVTDGFQFSVDGVVKKTLAADIPRSTEMRLIFSAFNGAPMPPLQVDWVRIPPARSKPTGKR